MTIEEFRRHAHQMVDWMADYFQNVEEYPVKSPVKPGEIIGQLPQSPPEEPETFETMMEDVNTIIMPGMTHWQSPAFFAYFNANNSYPSILAEMIMSTMGAQCMSWQTSPAATELEERVMQWLGQLTGMPKDWVGVIQDTASAATLCALLSAREQASDFTINRDGFPKDKTYTIYCSSEAHSSVEKAVKIAGFGSGQLRKIAVDDSFAMIPAKLEEAIAKDREQGLVPLAVVVALGTTGSTAVDPLKEIGPICRKHKLWLHIDAAYAGTALLLPEKRDMIDGIDMADSFVFNPHKWMFTNFDCSAYFVKDKGALIRTFEILPEYLKTREGSQVNNYRDWGVALGRRFRALKLWFVIRSFGASGLRAKVADHIRWAQDLAKEIDAEPDFQLLAPVPFGTICFHFKPKETAEDLEAVNTLNATLLETLNDTGKLYLTHTKLNGVYTLRLVIGQTNQTKEHIDTAWKLIRDTARSLK
jgi:aromatic-L-amino-acid decarboxylase